MKSIPAQNEFILRPLLALSKEQLESYALKNNILWRDDSSNQKLDYLRNKIRHRLLPIVKEIPNMEKGLLKTISYLNDETLLVQEAIRRFEHEFIEKINQGYRITVQNSELYFLSLEKWFIQQGFKKSVNEIVRFLNQKNLENGKALEFGEWKLIKKSECFLLYSWNLKAEIKSNYQLQEGLTLNCPKFAMKVQLTTKTPLLENDIILDYTKIKLPLVLRSYQSGDFFYPENSKYKKKIGKFLRDNKIALEEKSKIPVFVDDEGSVLVVGNLRDKRFLPQKGKQKLILRCENY